MNETIRTIIEKEWVMFHTVNGDERVSCQDDQETFAAMRNAQYSVWSEETLQSYLRDLERAEAQGRNLAREKYIRMMKNTDPVGYQAFLCELPEVSEEKAALVAEIWSHMLAQTERLRERYPTIALGGRPLHAAEEAAWPSIESYQKGELLTYSKETLALYLKHLVAMEEAGTDLVYQIQENSVTCMGYANMDEAERALERQIFELVNYTLPTTVPPEGGCSAGACMSGMD